MLLRQKSFDIINSLYDREYKFSFGKNLEMQMFSMRDMIQRRIMKRLLILFSTITLISCSYTTVKFTLDRPAPVDLRGHTKIAIINVEPFSDSTHFIINAKNIGDRIGAELIRTQHFEVLDRQYLETLLSEQELSLTGLVNENSTVRLGNITGATILLQLTIDENLYSENTTYERYDDKILPHPIRHGKYSLSITFKIIDIETTEVLSIFNLSDVSEATTKAKWFKAPAIIPEDLYEKTLDKIINKFITKVNPTSETLKLKFELDADLPEINQAVSYFRIGEITDGLTILENLRKKPNLKSKILAKIEYNIGVAQLMLMRYDIAIESYKRAIKLYPSNNRYHKAIKNAKYEFEMSKDMSTSEND